jgi:hypothetical protein
MDQFHKDTICELKNKLSLQHAFLKDKTED